MLLKSACSSLLDLLANEHSISASLIEQSEGHVYEPRHDKTNNMAVRPV